MKGHVLDANALYRYLTGGPGAEVVSRLFRDARDAGQSLRMSVVNWGEVYYTVARAMGFLETVKIMERVKMLPLAVLDADELTTTRAAKLKAVPRSPLCRLFRSCDRRSRRHSRDF